VRLASQRAGFVVCELYLKLSHFDSDVRIFLLRIAIFILFALFLWIPRMSRALDDSQILGIDCGGSCSSIITPTARSKHLCSTHFCNSTHLRLHNLGLHFLSAWFEQHSPRRRRQPDPANRFHHKQLCFCIPPRVYGF
jgi:hypothetical protein